jgi:hypothetical protein
MMIQVWNPDAAQVLACLVIMIWSQPMHLAWLGWIAQLHTAFPEDCCLLSANCCGHIACKRLGLTTQLPVHKGLAHEGIKQQGEARKQGQHPNNCKTKGKNACTSH